MLRSKSIFAVIVCTAVSAVISADPVIIFNPMQIDSKKIEAGLFNDLVSAELSCAENIKLVDRAQLDKLLKEKSLKPNGMLDAGDAGSIGTLLGADHFISGSVREKGSRLLIFIKSISVKTGVVRMKYINSADDLEAAAKKSAQAAVELIKTDKDQTLPEQNKGQLLFPEKKRPAVAVCIPEIHIASRRLIDPAAENELIKILLEQKFNVKQLAASMDIGKSGFLDKVIGSRTTLIKAAEKAGADYLVYGEAVSESSDTFGNYRTSRARVELKIIAVANNNIIWAASTYAGAADTAEIISGKKAIQKAAAKLASKAAEAMLK